MEFQTDFDMSKAKEAGYEQAVKPPPPPNGIALRKGDRITWHDPAHGQLLARVDQVTWFTARGLVRYRLVVI